jgi:hypothetical protein
MTLANMRPQGVRSLWVVCDLCHLVRATRRLPCHFIRLVERQRTLELKQTKRTPHELLAGNLARALGHLQFFQFSYAALNASSAESREDS